jgi:hypothetical protein
MITKWNLSSQALDAFVDLAFQRILEIQKMPKSGQTRPSVVVGILVGMASARENMLTQRKWFFDIRKDLLVKSMIIWILNNPFKRKSGLNTKDGVC